MINRLQGGRDIVPYDIVLYSVYHSAAVLAWHGILLTVSGQLDLPLSARSQGQTTIAMVGKSGKRTRPRPSREVGGVRMLES